MIQNCGSVLEAIPIFPLSIQRMQRVTKFMMNCVGFESHFTTPISTRIGCAVFKDGGLVVSSANRINSSVQTNVEKIAQALSCIISTHDVVQRFNSSGESGGAWLVTSTVDGIGANSDIGISYRPNTYTLFISSKYLADHSIGNKKSALTAKNDLYFEFDNLDLALRALRLYVKHASQEEARNIKFSNKTSPKAK